MNDHHFGYITRLANKQCLTHLTLKHNSDALTQNLFTHVFIKHLNHKTKSH